MRNNVIKAIKDPVKALQIINRKYFRIGLSAKDPDCNYMKTWVYGKCKRLQLKQIFPDIENISYQIMNGYNREYNMALTLLEINAINAIVMFLKPDRVFEIGTFDGGTTLNIAANIPENSKIYTADLPQDFDFKNFFGKISSVSDNRSDFNNVGSQYKNTIYEKKVIQIFQDSAKIDFTKYNLPFDIFFIDGCHDYRYVKIDTMNAVKYTRKGGVILWHDYGMIKDVSDYLDNNNHDLDINLINGTRLAIAIIK